MEYSRQLAQKTPLSYSDIESTSSQSDSSLQESETDPVRPVNVQNAPEISVPNLTSDWDTVWNMGRLGNSTPPAFDSLDSNRESESKSPSTEPLSEAAEFPNQTETWNQEGDILSFPIKLRPIRPLGDSEKTGEESSRSVQTDAPSNAASLRRKAAQSEEQNPVDDDPYNWSRRRSTLRAVKGALESYQQLLDSPNPEEESADATKPEESPVEEEELASFLPSQGVLKPPLNSQNAPPAPADTSAEKNNSSESQPEPQPGIELSPILFTAEDFIGNTASINTLEESNPVQFPADERIHPVRKLRDSDTERPAASELQSPAALNIPQEDNSALYTHTPMNPVLEPEPILRNPEPVFRDPASSPQEQTIVSVRHLFKRFTRGGVTVPVLQDLSVQIQRCEFTAIVGQSGSGKSTLLNALGLLCKIDAGEIHFEDKRIDNLYSWQKDRIRNFDLGLVFQFYHLLPEFTTLENIMAPMMIRFGVFDWFSNRRKYRQRALELIKLVGLEHRIKHKPKELSGGEMQRAAIARALIGNPKLLLADEPTGNLDQKTGREILELLYSLKEQENLTIVMVTHDPQIAREADKTYTLSEGTLK